MRVDHAVNEIDEIWQHISRREISKRDEITQISRGGLAVHYHPDWLILAQGVPPGAPKY